MFYVTVSVIAFILLIIMLYSVRNKISSSTPGSIPASTCPDYWYSSYYDVTGDPVKDEQMNLSSYGDELDRTLKCYNVKKLGSKTCSSSMDFSGDKWNGPDGLCKKQKWAKACGLTWDGVTSASIECPLTKEPEPATKVTDLIFKKMDNTNCIQGRVDSPGESTDSITYLGTFDSYEECSKSGNIPSNTKAITYHSTSFKNGWGGQCFSVTDNNTNAVQDNITCGIVIPKDTVIPKGYKLDLLKDSRGNDIRRYENKTMDYLADACTSDINCKGFNNGGWLKNKLGDLTDDVNYNFYTKLPGSAPISAVANFVEGQSTTCSTGDPLGNGSGAVYRYVGNNTIRYYPTPDIASSWDPNWASPIKIDCTGLTQGATMTLKEPVPKPFKIGSQQNTPWNEEGGGNALYLDRHDVSCSSGALNQLKLQRKGDAQGNPDGNYRYDFTCTTGGSLGPSQNKTTPFNDDGGGNALFLDRHNIKCDNNEVLTELRLKRNDKNQYQYQYKCAPSTKLTCRTDSTQWNSEGNGRAVYLDRHDIKCKNDEALSQLHLVRKGDAQGNPDGNYRYDYTCCSE